MMRAGHSIGFDKSENCVSFREHSHMTSDVFWVCLTYLPTYPTLESVIDVGQGISVGPGKFDKKNKRRALNTHVLCSK